MSRKERIYEFMQQKDYLPLRLEELVAVLDVPLEDIGLLEEILNELIQEGKIIQTKKKRFAPVESVGLITGRFQGHERGFGFVLAEPTDLFIPADAQMGALHGDLVLAKVTKASGKREGEIVKILEHTNHIVIGTFEQFKNHGFLIPDDKRISKDIYLAKSDQAEAKDGQKVVVEITEFHNSKRNPEGKIIEVLGYPSEHDTFIRSALRRFGIRDTFSENVTNSPIPSVVSETELQNRKDFRNKLVLTIDGDDAKDFDDAISLEKNEDGTYLLGVHIADVSHYVTPDSPLDKEAYQRGTSVYLVDRVIPMLPENLSNGICSLKPNVDRLTLSIEMTIDQKGTVKEYNIVPAVIHSKYRMTYHNVTKTLEDPDYHEYDHLRKHFHLMEELAEILRRKRIRRGSLDFDFPEAKILLDKKGKPTSIEKYEITISNHIIEEFMLLANETVAEHVFWLGVPLMYRVHETPTSEKMEQFAKMAKHFGYSLKGAADPHPRALQEILNACKGKREERILSTMMLRSLMKAEYKGENLGHFGLAAKFYCHFTSPIRRYPDLIVHRVLKELLKGNMSEYRKEYWKKFIDNAAGQCSETERNAEEIEREIDDIKKAEYMQQFIGDSFEGTISSITSFGMFVELDNTVEGLVRLISLEQDDFRYIEEQMMLLGYRTGKTYRIGDVVQVRLIDAKPALRQIDFVIEEEEKSEN
ncbi:MAG: ribonuclease R [Ruminococcaceae bacterium]|nr:ribonuclease R [Oscillospiraceae bacterium]